MFEHAEPGIFKSVWNSAGQVFAWAWLLAIALWGGTANYITRIKKTGARFSIIELIGEWSVSGFAGLITALVGAEAGWSFYFTAAAAGVSGHMGGRAIGLLENWLVEHRKL